MTQNEALDIMKIGSNVLLTGAAGSGKTYLLNQYISYLRDNNVVVAVTASTGIAATHMDGITIHSWSGARIKKSLDKDELKKVIYDPKVRARILAAKVLIIDEISMLDADVFDLIEMLCRTIRKQSSAFGGLQVVLCGDFFQLPPVHKRGEPKPNFAFSSKAWQKLNVVVCYLEKQHRQDDQQFLSILNAIRDSKVSKDIVDVLMQRHQKPIEGVLKPTKLYTHNLDVDAINSLELAQIKLPIHTYEMTSSGDQKLVNQLKKNCLAPENLEIKKGALVMFVKNNFGLGYVNGTLGTVIGFDENNEYPIIETNKGIRIIAMPTSWVTEEDDIILAQINQVPLRLAWAITVHKSQGMSLDYAEIDLSKAFIDGMGYVALSRVRSLAGIKLMGFNEQSLKVDQEITLLDQELKELSEQARQELKEIPISKKESAQKAFIL